MGLRKCVLHILLDPLNYEHARRTIFIELMHDRFRPCSH